RRQILSALAEKDLDLPALMKVTGRSKPTLSNLHVRELLDRKLVEERPHPRDSRRKLYRLIGRKIGSSDVPIEQLRGVVKQYAVGAMAAHAIPLADVLDIITTEGVGKDAAQRMGRALGTRLAALFPERGLRDLSAAVAAFWEREGLARLRRVDLDRDEMEVELGPRAPEGREEAMAELLGGVLAG